MFKLCLLPKYKPQHGQATVPPPSGILTRRDGSASSPKISRFLPISCALASSQLFREGERPSSARMESQSWRLLRVKICFKSMSAFASTCRFETPSSWIRSTLRSCTQMLQGSENACFVDPEPMASCKRPARPKDLMQRFVVDICFLDAVPCRL